jgi:hypothetical protein
MPERVDANKQAKGSHAKRSDIPHRSANMKGRPDLERIAQLKRRSHKIFAMYDSDPDNFWLQHAMVRDIGVLEHGTETSIDTDEDDTDKN